MKGHDNADRAPLLRMTGIGKSFPGVHALQNVSSEEADAKADQACASASVAA